MVSFYKVALVVEANSYEKATEKLSLALCLKSGDVWIKEISKMTNDEIFEFFKQTKEEMEKESNEY